MAYTLYLWWYLCLKVHICIHGGLWYVMLAWWWFIVIVALCDIYVRDAMTDKQQTQKHITRGNWRYPSTPMPHWSPSFAQTHTNSNGSASINTCRWNSEIPGNSCKIIFGFKASLFFFQLSNSIVVTWRLSSGSGTWWKLNCTRDSYATCSGWSRLQNSCGTSMRRAT